MFWFCFKQNKTVGVNSYCPVTKWLFENSWFQFVITWFVHTTHLWWLTSSTREMDPKSQKKEKSHYFNRTFYVSLIFFSLHFMIVSDLKLSPSSKLKWSCYASFSAHPIPYHTLPYLLRGGDKKSHNYDLAGQIRCCLLWRLRFKMLLLEEA